MQKQDSNLQFTCNYKFKLHQKIAENKLSLENSQNLFQSLKNLFWHTHVMNFLKKMHKFYIQETFIQCPCFKALSINITIVSVIKHRKIYVDF